MDDIIKETEEKMKKAIDALKKDMTGIRTGRASAGLIDHLVVEYYGAESKLNTIASVTVPEPRLIVVQPWDKGAIGPIEKAIQKSELGLNPVSDGKIIRVPIPALTEERRRELVKVVKGKVEDGKVSVRNIRRDHIAELKELLHEKLISEDEEKRAQEKIEQLTTRYSHECEVVGQHKEHEILEV